MNGEPGGKFTLGGGTQEKPGGEFTVGAGTQVKIGVLAGSESNVGPGPLVNLNVLGGGEMQGGGVMGGMGGTLRGGGQDASTSSVLKSGCNRMERLATRPDCDRFGPDHGCQLQRNPPSPVASCRVSACHTKPVATSRNQL